MNNLTSQLDPKIQQLLQTLRARIKMYVWAEGISLGVIWVASMFWVGLAMDYLPILVGANELSSVARAILLVVVTAAFGYILYRWVFQRAFVAFSDRSMAILLERQFSNFNDSLVTSVTLKKNSTRAATPTNDNNETDAVNDVTYSRQMLSETVDSALLSLRGVDVNQVFNKRLLLKRVALAIALVASVTLFAVTNESMANLAMRRLYLLDGEKWERAAHIQIAGVSVIRDNFTGYDFQTPEQLNFIQGHVKVARGAALRILIQADGNKQIPERCSFHYETADGLSGQRRLIKEGGAPEQDQYFVLADNPINGISESLEFEIVGHDHRIGPFYIDVVESPEISQVTLDYEYPAYTELLPVEDQDWIPGRTSLPLGTSVKLNLLTNKPVQQLHIVDSTVAQYLVTYTDIEDARNSKQIPVSILSQSATPADAPQLWSESQLANLTNAAGTKMQFTLENQQLCACDESQNILETNSAIRCLTASGQQLIVQLAGDRSAFPFPVEHLNQDLVLNVSLLDIDGIISNEPFIVGIAALADKAPSVEIGLMGIGTAVTPDVIIPVTGTVSDDYGVQSSWFDVQLDEGDPLKFSITLVEGDQVQAPLDFREQRAADLRAELKPGEKINLSVRANDNYDLQGDPNIGSSSQFTLDVVTPTELLAGLERRELSLRQRYELIIAEVQGMRDSLQLVLESATQLENNTTDSTSEAEPEDNDGNQLSPEEKKLREQSLRLLRTQRAIVQSQKSNQESLGIAISFDDIRLQLMNNRVDTEDHKNRLLQKISDPLRLICEVEFPALDIELTELETIIGGKTSQIDQAASALDRADVVLLKMSVVLDNMLELETYNELIDLIRGLIDDQEQINEKTQQERKKQVLDLLK
ncbi:MAG: hypothetical protein HN617_17190 [Planctomycetaceae bacterium]|jgi:hypothetical protein|nr:hypothetical protein [Planctomycetaceae bacterium]MBT4844764.1 hypothetical protein [Planctomycetaceae bacterium]MBT5883719.1 hypothetical protein [Planctomycetaceae bacterium]MBT7256255.1 hypothetical protein [Planctomycetaceae bacterium]MBT7919272.1 hypothetical protein [Planctomycetaceae bacterium]